MTNGWSAKELADWLDSPAGPEVGPFSREEDEQRMKAVVALLRQLPPMLRAPAPDQSIWCW